MENSKQMTDNSVPATAIDGKVLPPVVDKTVILHPEQAATVFRRKLDKEMDELLPAPPNKIQKIMRIISYPIAVYIGARFGRIEVSEHIEKFASERGWFNGMNNDFNKAEEEFNKQPGDHKTIADRLGDGLMKGHEAEKEEILVKKGFGSTGEWEKLLFGKVSDVKIFKTLSSKARGKVAFMAAASGSLALGLGLTLSDNKNFFSFRSLTKKREKETITNARE